MINVCPVVSRVKVFIYSRRFHGMAPAGRITPQV
jgi:hypothetical protein